VPSDWSKMLLALIRKKGDIDIGELDPANYRAIALLSIPGKVFNRVILNRMSGKCEEFLSNHQI